jgi:hypothetical protein
MLGLEARFILGNDVEVKVLDADSMQIIRDPLRALQAWSKVIETVQLRTPDFTGSSLRSLPPKTQTRLLPHAYGTLPFVSAIYKWS